MSERTRKKSRHNAGRKPFYKEFRRHVMPKDAPTIEQAAQQILNQPRWGGSWLNCGVEWDKLEESRLRLLCETASDIAKSADAIGRTPYAIAYRARELGLMLPSSWNAIVRPKRSQILTAPREPLLCYPYVKKATPDASDLLRANALVPSGMPEWMRADVCQSVMLALYQGEVTLDDLEANKTSLRWFIKKFYKDQMPREEVQIGRDDDERSWEDIAASVKNEAVRFARDQVRETFDSYASRTEATQIDDIYSTEIGAAHFALSQNGPIERDESIERLNSGEIKARDLNYKIFREKDGMTIHARQQLFERFGIQADPVKVAAILAFCRNRHPDFVTYGREIHRLPGNNRHGTIPFLYSRESHVIITILPSARR